MGHSKEFSFDGQSHIFPDYSQGETSYNVSDFTMAEGHPRTAFDPSKIEPPNNTEAVPHVERTEVGSTPLGLSAIS